MLSTALFGLSLLGLVALFGCKVLELTRDVRTPLAHVRRIGDPLVNDGWFRCAALCRNLSLTALQASANWLKTAARKARSSFDVTLHALTARLNRYLRGRRIEMRINGEPSVRLKTVLQKTEESTTLPPPSS